MKKFTKSVRFTTEDAFLRTKGKQIWFFLCDAFGCDELFTIDEAANYVSLAFGYTHRTARQYVSSVLANVIAEYEAKGLGDCPVTRVSNSKYRL